MANAYTLKLFVAGNSDQSQQIYVGLCEVLQGVFPGDYELEVVDVLVYPDKAKEFGVFATPTLIKNMPEPIQRVVGKLNDKDSIVMAVELIKKQGQ